MYAGLVYAHAASSTTSTPVLTACQFHVALCSVLYCGKTHTLVHIKGIFGATIDFLGLEYDDELVVDYFVSLVFRGER